MGYNPWGCKESDMTERLTLSLSLSYIQGFSCDTSGKNTPANAGDLCLIPEWGRSPGEGNGNPLQYFLPGASHGQEPGRLWSMGSQSWT